MVRDGAEDATDQAVVVDHGHVRADPGRGAGVDGDGEALRLAGADRHHPGRHEGRAEVAPRRVVRPSYSARRLRSKPASSTWLAEVGVLRLEVAHLVGEVALAAEPGGTEVKGRTAAAAADSAGPNTSPTARRAGSSGELAPPETSRVMRVTLASTSADQQRSAARGCATRPSRPVRVARRPSCRPEGQPIHAQRLRPRPAPAGGPRTPPRTCPRRGHRGQRVLGDVHRHAGLVAQPLVEAAQQRAAAGEHDAAVHDVAGELGRGLVEGGADGVDDRVQRLLERLARARTLDTIDGARQAGDHVAAADLGLGLAAAAGRPSRGSS